MVGLKWWLLFKRWNPEIESKDGIKYPRNQANHCHGSSFQNMYNQNENGLVKSGNAVRFDRPVHMDSSGKIVDAEVHAFVWPESINMTFRDNVFVMDETGDNTHGKNDSIKGGEKKIPVIEMMPRHAVNFR